MLYLSIGTLKKDTTHFESKIKSYNSTDNKTVRWHVTLRFRKQKGANEAPGFHVRPIKLFVTELSFE